MDRQSEAYRLASEANWASVGSRRCAVYVDGDERPIRTPQEWDADGWDDDRTRPKTVAEAREALMARIADPYAPDDETVAHAYDHRGA